MNFQKRVLKFSFSGLNFQTINNILLFALCSSYCAYFIKFCSAVFPKPCTKSTFQSRFFANLFDIFQLNRKIVPKLNWHFSKAYLYKTIILLLCSLLCFCGGCTDRQTDRQSHSIEKRKWFGVIQKCLRSDLDVI